MENATAPFVAFDSLTKWFLDVVGMSRRDVSPQNPTWEVSKSAAPFSAKLQGMLYKRGKQPSSNEELNSIR